jgi:PAS domain S-box-containing protein
MVWSSPIGGFRTQMPHAEGQRSVFAWLSWIGLAVAVGIVYFMAARFGLAFRAKPGGVAVFWPAAGVAIGALIALGRDARLPVATAVVVATITSKLLITGNFWLGTTFALVCAAQTLLTAWLVERWFGRGFKLEAVPQVLGFLVASAVGAAVAAFGAVAAVSLVQSTASALDVWRLWFASCLLGTVTVAPLLIGLGGAICEPPSRRELIEGTVGLVALAVVSIFVISLPQGPWATALPVALVFPILLWVAVRCRPVFAAAAAFVVALAVIWSATFDMGHFGDASIPVADRILAAQTLVLAGALLAFLLAALFAERRQSESTLKMSEATLKMSEATLKMSNERLKDSNDRLQLALDAAELGVWSVDPTTGRFENDARDRRLHRHQEAPKTLAEARPLIHPDDLPRLDAAFGASGRSGGNYKAEYRLAPIPGHTPASDERWIAVEGTVVRRADGRPERLLGVTRDISERKRAEQALAERNMQLALAGKAGLVGTYAHDVDKDMMQVSEGYAAIHGLPEGTTESSRSEWMRRAHPEDLARKLEAESKAIRERGGEYSVEYRIVRHGEVRWIESRSFISYDNDGSPQRVIGVNIDITERKRAEQHQSVLVAELDHRVKNVLATVSAVAGHTLETSSSMSHFVAALDGRIRSMATVHELLSTRRWRGMPMAELLQREFAAYASTNNTEIDGPEVMLSSEAGQAMAMVIHELVTNAAKHGALSTKSGRVSVRWYRKLNGSAQLVLIWQETGGPRVEVSKKSGYGTGIVRDLIPYEFGGTVDFSLSPEGVRCRLEVPFDRISSDNRN